MAMRYGVILSLILLMTCSSVEPKATSVQQLPTPTTQPVIESKVRMSVPFTAIELKEWIDKRLPECCAQLGIPLPEAIVFEFGPPKTTIDEQGFRGYLLGDYLNKTIRIFLRNGYLQLNDMATLKNTFYHELLHWWDANTGKPFPEDHNEIFNKRIKELGWN